MKTSPKPILASLNPAQLEYAMAMLDRFADRSGGPATCWLWTGGTLTRGYGNFWTRGTARTRQNIKVHRLAYELAHDGECPPVIDHICHDNAECNLGELCPHRRCCNPAHLAAETNSGNLSRAVKGIYQETCRAGHRMSGENLYESPGGFRRCRRCAADRAQERRAAAERRVRAPLETPRPRGVGLAELVAWALDGQDGPGCMFWPGVTPDASGYVNVRFGGPMIPAHRLVYQVEHGSIAAGNVVDHVCHDPQSCAGGLDCPHRACVNPDHLQSVPAAVNTAVARSVRHRPEACHKGHLFTEENTFVSDKGTRSCIFCKNIRQRARVKAAKEATNWTDKRFREGDLCPNGHDVTEVGLTSVGKCAQCTRDAGQRARRTAREKRGAAGPPERAVAPGALCVNGHDKSVVGISSSYACNECVRERKRAKRAEVKSGPGWADKRTGADGMCKKGLHVLAVTGKTTNGSCAECKREGDARRSAGLVADGPGSRRTRQGGICRNGHDVSVVGIAKGGSCAECTREKSRRFAARRELRR